ncbi:MAG: hypothetical protein LUD50_04685 [Clostridia bacterium]|nr:hypothetical protein [Clostridia bacterium]
MASKYTGILTVEGTVLPDPSKMDTSDYDISSSERNANGIMVSQIIREDVHKVECSWNVLRPDDYMVIRNAIKKKFGLNVTYFLPDKNEKQTLEMYAGDRTTPIYTFENGEPVYKGFTLNFIEM